MTVILAACATEGARSERIGSRADELTAAEILGTSMPANTLALTFDDGPGDRTIELSQYLKAEGIRATFFVVGCRVAASPLGCGGLGQMANAAVILQQLADDGHLVANHTTTHRNLGTVLATGAANVVAELAETDADIAPFVPSKRFLFRAPFGYWPEEPGIYAALEGSAMKKYVGPVRWDVGGRSDDYPNRAADWACWQGGLVGPGLPPDGTATTAQCAAAYIKEIETATKGIVLMHDPYGGATGSTVDMAKLIIQDLKPKGYSFVRADELPAIAAQLCDVTCLECNAPASATSCTACAAKKYLTGGKCMDCDASCVTCDAAGASACLTCTAGKYLQGGACKTCSVCAGGTFQAAACNANADTVCAACDASCVTCDAAGAAACLTCDAGKFLEGGACKACTVCADGTFQSAACTANTDTQCTACDAACKTCLAAGSCSACSAGKYLAAGACTACTVCPAGKHVDAACTADADATCVACAAGTYSASAGATTCTACGSCDDANKCTTDRCDAAKGCVHDAIAGCTNPPDAGTDSGSSGGSSGGGASSSGGSSGTTSSGGTDPGTSVGTAGNDAGGEPAPTSADGGCSVSHRASSASPLWLLAAAWVLGRRSRRRVCRS